MKGIAVINRVAVFLALSSLVPMVSGAAPGRVSDALNRRAEKALRKGTAFLAKIQNPDGSYGTHKHPAISALCAIGLHASPADDMAVRDAAVDRAMTYALGFAQDDGSIFPKSKHEEAKNKSAYYPNYSTSICLLAMATINKAEYVPLMRKARAYLKGTQFKDKDSVDFGGIGYGKTTRADLSNGAWAAEALYYTEYLDREPHNSDPAAAAATRQMWTDFADFVARCQSLKATNPSENVSEHPDDVGGFFYRPNESKAGSRGGSTDTSSLISSGSMTYAGLKSLLYAHVERDDPRVKGAMHYLLGHYDLAENPGMGKQGMYYYYHAMSKALGAYGQDTLTLRDGRRVNWRDDLLQVLLEQQNADGSWVNEHGRFMESLPELATAYTMVSVKIAKGQPVLNAR